MSWDVFISYSSKDLRYAEALHQFASAVPPAGEPDPYRLDVMLLTAAAYESERNDAAAAPLLASILAEQAGGDIRGKQSAAIVVVMDPVSRWWVEDGAAAIEADCCDIYTDVDGVYTADPNVVPDARLLARVSYEEMLEMASLGAKVLQARSVEYAANYNVPVRVCSSFTDNPGTMVVKEDATMEKVVVSGIAMCTLALALGADGVLPACCLGRDGSWRPACS